MTTTNRRAMATLRPRKKPPIRTRARWTAGDAAGVAHAHTGGRTACHVAAIGERYAWPIVTRCTACLASREAHP